MGVVWVRNFKAPREEEISTAALEWKKVSRGKVDAVINKIRRERETWITKEGTSCPECGYITRNTSFPALCIYCGGTL
jgi:hypothetical protein